jgi:hypothetical protein
VTSEPTAWRTRVRGIVLHPELPKALVVEFDLAGRIWSGRAAMLVAAARAELGLDVALLRELDARVDDAEQVKHLTLVFEVRATSDFESLPWLSQAQADVAAVLAERASGRVPAGRVPWRQPGWLPVAEAWIGDTLAALGRPVHGRVEQFRLAELSCVLRAPTGTGDVFFKATTPSPLFVDEGRVMVTLAELFPGDVPAPLAVDSERHWMLLSDFGPDLGWTAPLDVREDVFCTYARLQVRATGAVDRLFAAGCLDRTPGWLGGYVTGWLVDSDLSRWLSADEVAELRAAGPAIVAQCAALGRLPVPDTIGHGDMHLGNVARRDGGYVFFDWTDACVMHPFLDMIAIAYADDAEDREPLREAYLAEWAAVAPYEQLLRAWRLAEPLAALNQAISYISIAGHLEGDNDNDGLREETGMWLRRVLDWSRSKSADRVAQ